MSDPTPAATRPTPLEVFPDGIPAKLKALPRWMGWKYAFDSGRWTKHPINIRTRAVADVTNPANWSTFTEALTAYHDRAQQLDGIAIVLNGDGLVGVDLDYCVTLDPEETIDLALDFLEDLAWVRRVEVPATVRGGRPTVEYLINPAVIVGSRRQGVLSVLSVGPPREILSRARAPR